MRSGACGVFVPMVLLLTAVSAGAQQRQEPRQLQEPQQCTPQTGDFALGVDVGALVPGAGLNPGLTVDGTAEYYLLSRLSLRGLAGWAGPGINNATTCTPLATSCQVDTWQQVRFEFSVVYNWEADAWHPYVLAGIGAHFLRDPVTEKWSYSNGTAIGRSPTASYHAGGGVEYFARPNVALRGEVTYHLIRHGQFASNPSGLTVTIGLKRYF